MAEQSFRFPYTSLVQSTGEPAPRLSFDEPAQTFNGDVELAGDPAQAQAKTKTWCHTLKHQGGPALRQIFEQLETTGWSVERLETHRAELQYFRNHEHKMDYPRYLANGWQIGSGPVESSCKRVVTQRLARSAFTLLSIKSRT